LTLGHGARRRLGSDAASAVLDVDRHHYRGIRPPKFSDDFVAGKPGVGLLEFVGDEQFGRIDRRALSDQMPVRRNAGDPGSAGGELVVQHQLVRCETQTLSTSKRCHDGDELFVNDNDFNFDCLRDGRIRKRDRRNRSVSVRSRRVDFIAHFAEHFVGQLALGSGMGNVQKDYSKCKNEQASNLLMKSP
jgi:hypothetical protein